MCVYYRWNSINPELIIIETGCWAHKDSVYYCVILYMLENYHNERLQKSKNKCECTHDIFARLWKDSHQLKLLLFQNCHFLLMLNLFWFLRFLIKELPPILNSLRLLLLHIETCKVWVWVCVCMWEHFNVVMLDIPFFQFVNSQASGWQQKGAV